MNELQQQQLTAIRERRAKMPDGDYTKREQHDDWGLVRRPDGWPFADVCMSVDYGHEDVGKTAPDFVDAKREFVSHAVADIDTLLTILADAERERDDANERRAETVMACELLQHRINFLEQNETVVWEVLQIPDGSTIHDVAAAVFKLRAELATATERAATAERELRVMLAPDRSNVRFHINGSELIAYWQVTSEDRDTVLCRSNGRFSDDLPGAIHTLYERVADAIERGEFRAKGGGDG